MTFEDAIELIIKHEGVFGDDPDDRGNWTTGVIGQGDLNGTKYGISAMAYPKLDIKNLTKDEAIKLYKRDYWDKIDGDRIPEKLSYMALDCAINQGVSYCKKELDAILQLSPLSDEGQVMEFKRRREMRYRQTKRFDKYGKGWLARLDSVTKTSLA